MERLSDWHAQLIATGARFGENGVVNNFGDPFAETGAMQENAIVVPLTGSGLISVSGEDALSFLNAQLTSDVSVISATAAQYSGYCTPKGRLLATMLLFADDNAHWLVLPGELADPVSARLNKYILRAKVKLEVVSTDFVTFGVAGTRAPAAVAGALSLPPAEKEFQVQKIDGCNVVSLPGNRYLVICEAGHAASTWQKLGTQARPAGTPLWALQTIRAGIATITAATQEMFTPQMVALDTHGGVSFEKGCYPGQEIVARTRYLGDVKRRLYHGRCAQAAGPGATVVDSENGKTVGTVTDTAEVSQGDWEFLAVLQREAVASQRTLRLRDGDVLTIDRAVD